VSPPQTSGLENVPSESGWAWTIIEANPAMLPNQRKRRTSTELPDNGHDATPGQSGHFLTGYQSMWGGVVDFMSTASAKDAEFGTIEGLGVLGMDLFLTAVAQLHVVPSEYVKGRTSFSKIELTT
jgi:hypothetical protein